jgi:hypothetical protein
VNRKKSTGVAGALGTAKFITIIAMASAGDTKGGSISVPLTSCLTSLE